MSACERAENLTRLLGLLDVAKVSQRCHPVPRRRTPPRARSTTSFSQALSSSSRASNDAFFTHVLLCYLFMPATSCRWHWRMWHCTRGRPCRDSSSLQMQYGYGGNQQQGYGQQQQGYGSQQQGYGQPVQWRLDALTGVAPMPQNPLPRALAQILVAAIHCAQSRGSGARSVEYAAGERVRVESAGHGPRARRRHAHTCRLWQGANARAPMQQHAVRHVDGVVQGPDAHPLRWRSGEPGRPESRGRHLYVPRREG